MLEARWGRDMGIGETNSGFFFSCFKGGEWEGRVD